MMRAFMRGTVKWFSSQKGYGFITPEDGGADVFVHHSSIQMKGYKTLSEGESVKFEVVDGPKGKQASEVIREADETGSDN